MKKRMERWLLLLPALLTAALLWSAALPGNAAAQRRPDQGDPAERLTRLLDLTDAQQAQVRAVLDEHEGRAALWHLAAALQPTLTEEQKEALFAPPERERTRQRSRRGRSEDGKSEDGKAAARPDSAMTEALDLTDEQTEALRTLREERRAEREGPPPLPEELAEILTPEQQEIVQIHRALALRMRDARQSRRTRGGPR